MLGPNGLIYFVPSSAHNVGIFDPSTSSFSTLDISNWINQDGDDSCRYDKDDSCDEGDEDGDGLCEPGTDQTDCQVRSSAKYAGGVLGPDGLIYFVPYNADNIGILSPSSSSFSTLDISKTISFGGKYFGGVLGLNGVIYFVPYNAGNVGILNPFRGQFTTLDISSTFDYYGGVLGPNGLVYFVPHYAHNIGKLDPRHGDYKVAGCGSGAVSAWKSLLSPHFNKF